MLPEEEIPVAETESPEIPPEIPLETPETPEIPAEKPKPRSKAKSRLKAPPKPRPKPRPKVGEETVHEDVPLSREELGTKFDELAARAREAGISPLQTLAQTYVKRGLAVIEGILGALEEAPNKTGTKKKD